MAVQEESTEDAVISDEPLIGDGDVPMTKNKGGIKTDEQLISADTLYADDDDGDPRKKVVELERKKKAAAAKAESAATMKAAKKSSARLEATKDSGWGDELEAELDEEAQAAQSEEDEEPEEEEEAAPKRRPSARGSQRIQAVSKPGSSRRQAEEEGDTRRSGRKSMRGSAPAKPFLTTKVKIIGGVSVFLILAVVVLFDPAIRMWHTKKLDEGPTLDDRKAAAEALFERYRGASLGIFADRLIPANADLRDAAVYGLELVGKNSSARPIAVDKLKEGLSAADAGAKIIFVRALSSVAKTIGEEKSTAPEQAKSDADDILKIAKALIPCSEADMKPDVRVLAVEGLAALPVPGVCKQLIKIAKSEKGELREKARAGIAATALPDAAGDLLETMTGDDKELAIDAKRSFGRIRTETKSELLLPLVTHPRDDVRREIVEALGTRANDPKAAQGITTALKDKLPEIRVLALKAIPKTGISGSVAPLAELVKDPEESVRIANAETLAQLRDYESQKVILESFKNDLQGKTMDAYITALGKRSSGKDMKSIGMVITILEANPAAEASIRPALVLLANHKTNRTNWTVAQWKAWYAKILERETTRTKALAFMEDARGRSKEDRSRYGAIAKEIDANLDVLEKCKEMSKPDDMEDVAGIDAEIGKYTKIKEFFFKGASVDMRN